MSETKKRSPADELSKLMIEELNQAPDGESMDSPSSGFDANQNPGSLATAPIPAPSNSADDRTRVLAGGEEAGHSVSQLQSQNDRTIVVRRPGLHPRGSASGQEPRTKVSFGPARSTQSHSQGSVSVTDAQLMQAENLRSAQARIIELERENEKLREENEMLSSGAEIAKRKGDDHLARAEHLERDRSEQVQHAQAEIQIYRENLQEKDREVHRLRIKVEELEHRLKSDFKKVRIRERELENRLELAKLEKNALIKTKDETILDLKRRMDRMAMELESYKERCIELNMKIDSNHDQLSRTVRALRLALTNLEVNENTSMSLVLTKKAE